MVLLGALLLCSGAVSAAMLWVIFGNPVELRHSDPAASGVRAEAALAPLSPQGTVNAEPSRPAPGSLAARPTESSQTPAGSTGADQPQPVQSEAQDGAGVGQPATSDAGAACSVDLCAATYRSFNAADCTYQPYGGGPRSICELGAQAAARSQISHAATDTEPEAPDAQTTADQATAKSAVRDQAGEQCNLSLCAATYKSFDAADCTYQPYGGGPRRICQP